MNGEPVPQGVHTFDAMPECEHYASYDNSYIHVLVFLKTFSNGGSYIS